MYHPAGSQNRPEPRAVESNKRLAAAEFVSFLVILTFIVALDHDRETSTRISWTPHEAH
jgi:hypothetical protein